MKKFTRSIVGVLILAMIMIGFVVPFTYADSPSSWAQDTIKTANEYNLPTTLIIGQGADANTLDPHGSNDLPSSRIMAQIYDTLVIQNENMEIEPGLAESWRFIDEATVEFTLKKGVKFHNGEEFKASDVKFTLLRAFESPNLGHIVDCIDPDGIRIIDDYKIRISTVEPYTPLLAHLAHTGTSILNEKATRSAEDYYGINPIGTGPFKFKSWIMGERVELVKFNEYHGKKSKVESIVFKNIDYAEDRFYELENGQIHIAYDILPSSVEKVEKNKELELYRNSNLTTSYIGFNTQKKPFNDTRVRQAINHAIDVEPIIQIIVNGIGEKANGPLGPNIWGYNSKLEPYEYNIEKAKMLLAEAGYANGFKTSIWTNDNLVRMGIAEMIKYQLEAVDIGVEIEVLEWGTYLDATANGEHDMFILGWSTTTGDPDYGLHAMFHSFQFGHGGNRQFYVNEKVDELLDKGRIETNMETRKEYYLKAQETIREDAPWVFLYNNENLSATRSTVKGFKQHPTGNHKLSGVYIK